MWYKLMFVGFLQSESKSQPQVSACLTQTSPLTPAPYSSEKLLIYHYFHVLCFT